MTDTDEVNFLLALLDFDDIDSLIKKNRFILPQLVKNSQGVKFASLFNFIQLLRWRVVSVRTQGRKIYFCGKLYR